MDTCPNCAAPAVADEFCPRCGQRNRHARLQARELAAEVVGQFLEWRMPWLRTLGELSLRPGLVALDYVRGKRARYVSPAKYFFVVVALAYLIAALFGSGTGGSAAVSMMMLLFVVMQVAVLRVLFWGADRNPTELTVFALYMTAHSQLLQMLLLNALMSVLEQRDTVFGLPSKDVQSVVVPTVIGVVYTYLVVGVGQFFDAPLWRSVMASIVAFGSTFFAILWLDFAFQLDVMR